MYTLDGIYNRLIDNTTSQAESSASFTTPGSVSATFHTLKQIYESIPTLDATKILTGTTYMGVAGSASAGQAGLPKTGQTHCNAFSGGYGSSSQIPCTATAQDGETQKGLAHGYVDNGDATITDSATGLMWQKCSDGQTGLDCSGGSAIGVLFDDGDGDLGITHQPAINYCDSLSLATHSDWRLPNVKELMSIVDYGRVNPAIDPTYFPATQSGFYWSSTAYENSANNAWLVHFSDGSVYSVTMNSNYFVRCVRG
ncbi:MAG: DUF1566 domain-containing protein [Candidatus Pacebacteria bacterium]|nr:DUF1566 domain-containing protein [Candidatus Paceibacterota bacterium]